MKKILFLIGVMAFTFMTFTAMAQHFDGAHVCGLRGADAAMVKEQMMQNREEMRDFVHQRGAITYVPIKLHLVADGDGEGRATERSVLDMMCILNEAYLVHEIQFYIKDGFNYIDHTNLHSNPSSSAAYIKMSAQKVNNAINVFVNLTIGGGGGGGTTLAYYQPPIGQADWIVITSGNVYGENVLPHEIGHFFSLSHPFYGWEDNPWNEAEWGNPVGNFAPSTAVPGTIQNDRMDQSNCTIAADGICDTPPDYLFGFTQNGCGNFNGNVMDFNGDVVDPMENNMMSYFSSCSSYDFTSDQVDAIYASLGSSGRNYVNPGTTPNLDDVTSVPSLNYPSDLSTVGYTSVSFNWSESAGATHYLFEIDRLSGFGFEPQYFITTDPGKTLTNLELDRTYYWRVRPFSPLKTCTGFSQVYEFHTDDSPVSTTEIASVKNWLVRPNPVAKNANIVIEMNSNEAFDAEVKVYSLTGQLLSAAYNEFPQGASTLEVNTSELNTGMYIVSVQSANGVMTQKIVVR